MIDDIKKDAGIRMGKSIESLKGDLTKLRTGRAHTSLLDHITVDYYGTDTPLNQVATVAVADARMLTVTPWEKPMVQAVEKAIMTSNLGLNPATSGTVIRVPLPPLTEERRKAMIKLFRKEGEAAKEAIYEQQPCDNVADYLFIEKEGLVNVEFENAKFPEGWKLKDDGNSSSGKGYMVWEGDQYLGNPGNSKTTFRIKIENSGTYQFLWKSAVKIADSGSDHNDTWLRFNDADDFYAQKENSIVYPKDSGKIPNPEGASKDGWFKIYRSGNDLDFKWEARTFDNNNAHNIYVVFERPGIYTMEISARSSGHGIDRFALFNASNTQEDAISDDANLSGITCN